jgi:hypothetical protein
MSLALILLSAKQKSAVNSYSSHYKMSRQKYSNNTLKNTHETNYGATASAVNIVTRAQWVVCRKMRDVEKEVLGKNSDQK